jgi:hypothetical protein
MNREITLTKPYFKIEWVYEEAKEYILPFVTILIE